MSTTTFPAALVVRAPAGRYLRRLGSFSLPYAIAEGALIWPVLRHLAHTWVLAAPPAVAVLQALLLLAIWPVSVTVTATDVVVRRLLRPRRRFDRAMIARSVSTTGLRSQVWHQFRLLALGDVQDRSLLRIDDKLVTGDDLHRLTASLAGPDHVVHPRYDSVEDLVETCRFAGTLLHRHYYLTRIGGFVIGAAVVGASIRLR